MNSVSGKLFEAYDETVDELDRLEQRLETFRQRINQRALDALQMNVKEIRSDLEGMRSRYCEVLGMPCERIDRKIAKIESLLIYLENQLIPIEAMALKQLNALQKQIETLDNRINSFLQRTGLGHDCFSSNLVELHILREDRRVVCENYSAIEGQIGKRPHAENLRKAKTILQEWMADLSYKLEVIDANRCSMRVAALALQLRSDKREKDADLNRPLLETLSHLIRSGERCLDVLGALIEDGDYFEAEAAESIDSVETLANDIKAEFAQVRHCVENRKSSIDEEAFSSINSKIEILQAIMEDLTDALKFVQQEREQLLTQLS